MLTVFERMPRLFVELYDAQFQTWGAEFRKRGPRCAIVFNRPPGVEAKLDEEKRVIAAGAWLVAEVDRSRSAAAPTMIVRPASEHDEELIARHCRAMRGHVLQ